MVMLFSIRWPDGTELGWLYAVSRARAEAFALDAVADQYGDGLLLVEVKRMVPHEAEDDRQRRKGSGLEMWWVG